MSPRPGEQERQERPVLFARYCSVCQSWADSESFHADQADDMHCSEDHRMEPIEVIPASAVEGLREAAGKTIERLRGLADYAELNNPMKIKEWAEQLEVALATPDLGKQEEGNG